MPSRPESRSGKLLRVAAPVTVALGAASFAAAQEIPTTPSRVEATASAKPFDSGQFAHVLGGRAVGLNSRLIDIRLPFHLLGPNLAEHEDAPRPAPTSYTVQRGDGFWSIAQKEQVDVYNLIDDNGYKAKPWGMIYPGQVLKLPAPGEAPAPPEGLSPPPALLHAVGSASSAPSGYTVEYASGVTPGGSFGACVKQRESGGNYQVMNSSGHYGAYQFAYSTWVHYGGNPNDFGHASPAEQDQVFANAMAAGGESNWAPYDGCPS